MSWKPEVEVSGNEWCKNGLVFETKEEAEANAKALMARWMLVTNTRACESTEPVNYKWENNELVPVPPPAS